MESRQVIVCIPVYKAVPDPLESVALGRCMSVLGGYRIVFVRPEGMDASFYEREYPAAGHELFDAGYFDGIQGYNRLMTSVEFYERFLDYEYMLVYQPDCYVFRDELSDWCARGYDYIGGPWVMRRKYRRWYMKVFVALKGIPYWLTGRTYWTLKLYNRTGNGGLSLRRVRSHYEVATTRRKTIEMYLKRSVKKHRYNEDVFWSVETPGFRIPAMAEALRFSIDQNPGDALEILNGELPFGCHGWSKPAQFRVWQDSIEELPVSLRADKGSR